MDGPTTTPAASPLEELQEVRFAAGLPGFPAARRFGCERGGGPDSPFVILRGREPVPVQFVVVSPTAYFTGYEPAITVESLSAIGLEDPADALVWVILTLGPDPARATANLLGPIVVNPRTGEAVQAVQPPGRWDARTPLGATL